MGVADHAHLVAMLLYSVKTNNLNLFHKSNADMTNMFFAHDHQNYSRHALNRYWRMLGKSKLMMFQKSVLLIHHILLSVVISVENYRCLVWLDAFLISIDKTHPGARELLKKMEE